MARCRDWLVREWQSLRTLEIRMCSPMKRSLVKEMMLTRLPLSLQDWMLPEAWGVEHNRLHHYHLGEDRDPDLVERNLDFVRSWQGPLVLKYAYVTLMACVWKVRARGGRRRRRNGGALTEQ